MLRQRVHAPVDVKRLDVDQYRLDAGMIVVLGDGEVLLGGVLHDGAVEGVAIHSQVADTLKHTQVLVVLDAQLGQLFTVDVHLHSRHPCVTVVLVPAHRHSTL